MPVQSEAAPHKYRGALNMMFQLAVTIGILAAQLVRREGRLAHTYMACKHAARIWSIFLPAHPPPGPPPHYNLQINYGTQDLSWGWRLSLGLAGVPATILLIGSVVLPETPNSLIERGRLEDGKKVLKKLRGTDDAEVGATWEAAPWGRARGASAAVQFMHSSICCAHGSLAGQPALGSAPGMQALP